MTEELLQAFVTGLGFGIGIASMLRLVGWRIEIGPREDET